MKIAVDIDGTLCWSNLPVFLDECNRQFNLNIDPDILNNLESKDAFYVLPEVQAARSEHPYLDDELAWIEFRERCLLASLPLDDAAIGVAKLASIGEIIYYTSRYSETPEIQKEIEEATFSWLKYQKLINYEQVVFCNRIQGKVLEILKIAKNDNIILIDDSYVRILEEIKQLQKHEYVLLQERLLLIAMRAYERELPSTDLNIVPLSSWEDIEIILERIQAHGTDEQCCPHHEPIYGDIIS
ncbi:hypothetical protein KDA_43370 [Dictyobacter alpinus]|uniref:Haloacid dehalogenase n=1 Tax=Dictyobacter alpinus TaxID=2014873 RepID=A0A402BBT9_9CHLR|nr:hypothetical protein [Dictyobacter alpinus]GCE28853.1 hypothetical protein KDA_43370 [Dictyobacter alpinus]